MAAVTSSATPPDPPPADRASPRPTPSRTVLLLGVAVIVLLALVGACLVSGSRPGGGGTGATSAGAAPSAASSAPDGAATPDSGLAAIPESRLPREAAETLRLIRAGGPFPHRQDGAVFQNRERVLPRQPRGYYHEYTVRTPGESDRGPRRLVLGNSGDLYWTTDHYATFQQVRERT